MRKNVSRTYTTAGIILVCLGVALAPSLNADQWNFQEKQQEPHPLGITIEPGSLSGYVYDDLMNPIQGAKVQVFFHNTSRENLSDATGYYHVTDIPICYCMKNATCSKKGYHPAWVNLSIFENTTHNFTLIARGTWLYVGGSGPENYTKIQDAINDSSAGDTIFVYTGTYYEHLKVEKSLHLLGQHVESTIIDGEGNGSVVTILATVTISGFTIQHSGRLHSTDAGILSYDLPEGSYTFNISGNCFRNNKNGIFLKNAREDLITGNAFMDNEQGVCLFLTDDCTITRNNFINNTNDATFTYFFLLQRFPRNNWFENYWDDWSSVLPKSIHGVKEIIYLVLRPGAVYSLSIPWINFDWHPAQQPYALVKAS